ncbi:hypothetical protein BP5796_05699 [Coleophoma crateriformis]|uniref:CBM-cenC domain-containing protein n=1 Tax=Coleophoma crateriformis TaxID=565419 RepID=A0A3D8RUV1_9HELO|nr:hypothetical protein BP5796_05699 [Coleophoma crateriformis]
MPQSHFQGDNTFQVPLYLIDFPKLQRACICIYERRLGKRDALPRSPIQRRDKTTTTTQFRTTVTSSVTTKIITNFVTKSVTVFTTIVSTVPRATTTKLSTLSGSRTTIVSTITSTFVPNTKTVTASARIVTVTQSAIASTITVVSKTTASASTVTRVSTIPGAASTVTVVSRSTAPASTLTRVSTVSRVASTITVVSTAAASLTTVTRLSTLTGAASTITVVSTAFPHTSTVIRVSTMPGTASTVTVVSTASPPVITVTRLSTMPGTASTVTVVSTASSSVTTVTRLSTISGAGSTLTVLSTVSAINGVASTITVISTHSPPTSTVTSFSTIPGAASTVTVISTMSPPISTVTSISTIPGEASTVTLLSTETDSTVISGSISTIYVATTINTCASADASSTTTSEQPNTGTTAENLSTTISDSSTATTEDLSTATENLSTTTSESSTATTEDLSATITQDSSTTAENLSTTTTEDLSTATENPSTTTSDLSTATIEDLSATITQDSSTTAENLSTTTLDSSTTTTEDLSATITQDSSTIAENLNTTTLDSSTATTEDLSTTMTQDSTTTTSSPSCSATPPIQNSDFESGTINPWTVHLGGPARVDYYDDADHAPNAHSGSGYVEFTTDSDEPGVDFGIIQYGAVCPDTDYQVEIYIALSQFSTPGGDPTTTICRINVQIADTGYIFYPTGISGWQRLTATVTPHGPASPDTILRVFTSNNFPLCPYTLIRLDDISITPVNDLASMPTPSISSVPSTSATDPASATTSTSTDSPSITSSNSVAISTSCPTTRPNQIINGDFETGTLDPWDYNSAGYTLQITNQGAHSGTYAVYMQNPANAFNNYFRQGVTLDPPPTGSLVMTAWAQKHASSQCQFHFELYSSSGEVYGSDFPLSTTYQKYSTTYNLPGDNYRLTIAGVHCVAGMTIDDITFTVSPSGQCSTPADCSPSIDGDVLVNGGFECLGFEGLEPFTFTGSQSTTASVLGTYHSGSYGLRIWDWTDNPIVFDLSQTVSVVPSQTYQLTGWASSISASGQSPCTFQVIFDQAGISTNIALTTSGFTSFSVVYTGSPETFETIHIHGDSTCGSDLYLDDLSFVPLGTCSRFHGGQQMISPFEVKVVDIMLLQPEQKSSAIIISTFITKYQHPEFTPHRFSMTERQIPVDHPNHQRLLDSVQRFLAEVQNLIPGKDLERHLNEEYGPGNAYYDTFASIVRQGILNSEGWLANIEVDGPKYHRSKVSLPMPQTQYFSVTTVYMDSVDEYRGQYHQHPYGEINCVILIDPTAELMGMSGWQGAGWTSPGPGTHHYPQVRGGALVALFFLPAGRISYEATANTPQPISI